MDSSDESESVGEEERRKVMNGAVWRRTMTTERKRVFLAVTHFVVDCFGRDIESRALAEECVQFKRKQSRVVRVHNSRNLLRGTERNSSPKMKQIELENSRKIERIPNYIPRCHLVFSRKFSQIDLN